jgi:proteasome lid subunit RPN8/RPN11
MAAAVAMESAQITSAVVLEPANYFQVGQDEPGLAVYLRHDLFRALDEYAVRDTSRELSALLVGQVGAGLEGEFLMVEDAIEIPASEKSNGRLTTLDWQQASKVAKAKHQDKIVVGWYHTHPGTGSELTSEERELHANFFPEAWQVLYVVDPVTRDRAFHRSLESKLCSTRGFRVYGRDALSQSAERNPKSELPEKESVSDSSRERYVERTLEKLVRQTRRPAVRPIELVLVVLLLANLIAPFLRPSPTAKVDLTALRADQSKVSSQVGAQIKVIGSRIDKLEQHLAALRILDEQLASTPAATPSSEPSASASPVADEPKIKEIKVEPGQTLAGLTYKEYGSSDKKIVSSLAHYNDLRSLDIKAGQTLKFPPKESLK